MPGNSPSKREKQRLNRGNGRDCGGALSQGALPSEQDRCGGGAAQYREYLGMSLSAAQLPGRAEAARVLEQMKEIRRQAGVQRR